MSANVDSKTADLAINLGEAIRRDETLASMSRNAFKRAALVAVGGYAQSELDENAAPFVWIYPQGDPVSVVLDNVTDYTLKIIVGLCPKKDAPNPNAAINAALVMEGAVGGQFTAAEAAVNAMTEAAPEKPSALEVMRAAEADYNAGALLVEGLRDLANQGDSAALLTALRSAYTKLNSAFGGCVQGTLAAIRSDEPEAVRLGRIAQAREEDTEDAIAASSEQTSLYAQEIADYEESPFIVEKVAERTSMANGLTIYGAIRLLENFRSRVMQICRESPVGMPLKEMTMTTSSISQYPLDWTEITATFGEAEKF